MERFERENWFDPGRRLRSGNFRFFRCFSFLNRLSLLSRYHPCVRTLVQATARDRRPVFIGSGGAVR
jgi:hypothetical protein